MKARTIILLVVAVGCGLGASVMTSRLLADRGKAEEPEPMVKVLVAKASVVGYMPIKEPEKLFEVREIPERIAPKRPVSDLEELKDQKLNKTIAEDHLLLKDDLLNKDQMALGDHLKPGQIAVAIKVNAESLAGGFVLPGAKVVVISTESRSRDYKSRMVLQDMLVLAVGDNSERDPEKKSLVAPTVTLAATPEEAGRLKLAQAMGELSLLLKPPGEQTSVKHFVVQPDDLNNPIGTRPAPAAEGSKEAPTARGRKVLPELAPDTSPDKKAEEKKAEDMRLAKKKQEDRDRHRMVIINGSTVIAKVMRLGGDPDEGGTAEQPTALPKDNLKPKSIKYAPPTYPAGGAGGSGSRTR